MTDKKHKQKEEEKPIENSEQAAGGESAAGATSELESLKSLLAEAQSKTQEYLDALQRERADFTNYRRRVEQEKIQLGSWTTGETIKKLLPVMDDLERALANRPEGDSWANGVELVYRKFQAILEREGVTRMEAEGEAFDPNLHEAILQEPSEKHESGMVTAVLQQGYMLGERVLRPAQVKVAQ